VRAKMLTAAAVLCRCRPRDVARLIGTPEQYRAGNGRRARKAWTLSDLTPVYSQWRSRVRTSSRRPDERRRSSPTAVCRSDYRADRTAWHCRSPIATAPTRRPATAGLLATPTDEYYVTGVRRLSSLTRSWRRESSWRRPSRRRFRGRAQRILTFKKLPLDTLYHVGYSWTYT